MSGGRWVPAADSFVEWLTLAAEDERFAGERLVDFSGTAVLSWSYPELVAEVGRVAETWATIGLLPGHTVLLAMPSGLRLAVQILALMRLGAVPVPVSNVLAAETYAQIVRTVRPAAVLGNGRVFGELYAAADGQPFEAGGNVRLLVPGMRPEPNAELAGCVILTTSGSTGLPKMVVQTAANLWLNAALHVDAIEENWGGRYLSSLPVFYSYGLVAGLFGVLQTGKGVRFPEQPFFPHQWFSFCEEEGITLASMTPSLLKRLLDVDKPFPAALEKVTIGGDANDLADARRLRERFAGEIFLTYGLSEAGPRVLTQRMTEDEQTWAQLGIPLRSVEVQILGEVEDGCVTGELHVRTPTAMLGYLREDGSLSRDDFAGEWLRTGDVFACEVETGALHFAERNKNVLLVGGEKLYPGIIRRVLLDHPAVREAKVEARPDPKWGEVPVAVVQMEDGAELSARELTAWCRKRLRLAEVPRDIVFAEKVEVRKK
jgi:long-chain acyl-CoA synthetase